MSDPRFPVGKFEWPADVTPAALSGWIDEIAAAPAQLRAAAEGLSDAQLDTPYREGGWTVRQVVHHVPDSHMNSYVRFKLALTENEPTIKPYDEAAWAQLADTAEVPVATSLCLLECLHERWVAVLRRMSPEDWTRSLVHPELGKVTLGKMAALYAWHGKHHVGHITALRAANNW
jgi:uncharacterized damage-inducible protein DinB